MYHIFGPMKKAILLLGPTGSGKTPLGKLMERRGFRGRRCVHFDFGENLRSVAASLESAKAGGGKNDVFSPRERAVILDSLAAGALLENENFPIAAKILDRFASEKRIGPDDLLIMNGLPRHTGQARDLRKAVDVRAVVYLTGSAAVIGDRIRLDTGGDRTGRSDDSLEEVERKLEIFEKRTLPLLGYYARRRVPILNISVGAGTTAGDMLAELERGDIPGI